MILTALATAFYFVIGIAALLVPVSDCMCGMQSSQESAGEAFIKAALFTGAALASIVCPAVVSVFMWRQSLSWGLLSRNL